MPITPIDPIRAVRTEGGFFAIIADIDHADNDCFGGYLIVPPSDDRGGQVIEARWDRNGTCRNNEQAANIFPANHQELQDLINAIDIHNRQ